MAPRKTTSYGLTEYDGFTVIDDSPVDPLSDYKPKRPVRRLNPNHEANTLSTNAYLTKSQVIPYDPYRRKKTKKR